jgi:hypothetical protein
MKQDDHPAYWSEAVLVNHWQTIWPSADSSKDQKKDGHPLPLESKLAVTVCPDSPEKLSGVPLQDIRDSVLAQTGVHPDEEGDPAPILYHSHQGPDASLVRR